MDTSGCRSKWSTWAKEIKVQVLVANAIYTSAKFQRYPLCSLHFVWIEIFCIFSVSVESNSEVWTKLTYLVEDYSWKISETFGQINSLFIHNLGQVHDISALQIIDMSMQTYVNKVLLARAKGELILRTYGLGGDILRTVLVWVIIRRFNNSVFVTCVITNWGRGTNRRTRLNRCLVMNFISVRTSRWECALDSDQSFE